MDFDLSNVMFIATANSLKQYTTSIAWTRMEIIEVNGYTIEEKVEIAKQHLVPKQREAHGLKTKDVVVKPDIIEKLVELIIPASRACVR